MAESIRIGSRVRVHGLVSASQYNEQRGFVCGEGDERLTVLLESGKDLSVKRANLEVIAGGMDTGSLDPDNLEKMKGMDPKKISELMQNSLGRVMEHKKRRARTLMVSGAYCAHAKQARVRTKYARTRIEYGLVGSSEIGRYH